MTGRLFFLTAVFMTVSPANVFPENLNALPETIALAKAMDLKTAVPPCAHVQYSHKNFSPETVLPFPPGAFVEMKHCDDADLSEKSRSAEDASKREAIKKLSFLLRAIYRQQKDLEGSYLESDQTYQELLSRKLPNPEGYDRAVSNYEDALKNYGEHEAYLSALPKAVADYENKMGASFSNFIFQKADGAITMMKSPSLIDAASYDVKSKTEDFASARKTPGKLKAKRKKTEEQGGRGQEACTFMGAFAGAGVAENIVLAALSNPMGVLLGASLGATLCSQPVYQKIAGLQKKLGDGLVVMASYIKEGLSDIGNGLYRWGKEHLHQTPSQTGAKIAEHYENTRNWLNRKLGWQ